MNRLNVEITDISTNKVPIIDPNDITVDISNNDQIINSKIGSAQPLITAKISRLYPTINTRKVHFLLLI